MEKGSGSDPSVVVRPARAGDAKRIALLSHELGYPSTADEVRRRLRRIRQDDRHAVYAAQLPGGEIVGWVHLFLHETVETEPRAEVGGLVIDEAFRRRGLGRLLMRCAEEWALGKGCRLVSLRSNVVRKEAHLFYKRLGYRIAKTQHAFRKAL